MARDLHKLAKFYVQELAQPCMLKGAGRNASSDAPIYLLGWSLGGKLALEAAYVLERQGYTNVSVLMLDSFLTTPGAMTRYQGQAAVWEKEEALAEQPISGALKRTRVTLLKAGLPSPTASSAAPLKASFDSGGFSQCARKFTILLLKNYHHDNILTAHEAIIGAALATAPCRGSATKSSSRASGGRTTAAVVWSQLQLVDCWSFNGFAVNSTKFVAGQGVFARRS